MAEPVDQATDDVSVNVAVAEKTAAIARYWQSILEEESLYDIRVPRPPGIPAAVSLPLSRESAMHAGGRELVLSVEDGDIGPFLKVYGGGRLIYGYPVLHYPDGAIRPMFVLRAAANGNRLQFEAHAPRVNRGLLNEMGVTEAKQHALLAELNGLGFADCLAKVCELLHIDVKRFAAGTLEDGFEGLGNKMSWVNRPVLAAAAMNSNTATTVRELAELATDARSDVADRTALAAFEQSVPQAEDGQPPALDEPMVYDVHHLGPSQMQFARAGMNNRLTVAGALPGTGQMAAIVNLIATAVMHGQSVLYVARRPETVSAMTKHLDSWLGRGQHMVVQVGKRKTLSQSQQRIQTTLSQMMKQESAEQEADQPKTAREKPTVKDLRELDRIPTNTQALLQTIRAQHDDLRSITADERRAALKLDAGWATNSARKAPTPTEPLIRGWRDKLAGKNEGGGLGGMVKAMFSKGGTGELTAEIRKLASRMPPAVKAAAMEAMGDGDSADKIEAAIRVLEEFGGWKSLVDRRLDAIRRLIRLRDGRSIELQALNQAARKISGARELFRDSMRDRLLADSTTLEKQIATFFDLVGERDTGQDAGHRMHRSRRLAQAQQILAQTLPMWTGTPADIGVSLPLEPATFDLVVVDEADHLDLGAVLPLLYRADRAVLIGAPQGAARTTPLETDRGPGEAGAGLPTWATTYTVSALGGLSDWVRESGGAITQLSDHFRSHPVIADYLSTAFYDRSMVVHSNFRKLREGVSEDLLGLHWHEVGVGFSADGDGAVMESELSAVEGLLQKWDKAGVFELAPRRSIGISSQVAAQIDQLRENIRRGSYSTGVHERVTVAGPDAFVGRQIDFLIVLTGITGEHNPALPEDHAKDVRFYRDALASARLGVHVIGNREACKEAAGCLASLAAYCSGVAMEDDDEPRYDDEFERRLDSAFASESDDDKDPLPLLKDHLNQVGLPYQEYVTELDMPMLLRVLAPLGGRYNIEIAKPIDSIRGERELLREIDRDEKISALGYCVLRLTPEEILKKADYLLERLQRLV